MFGNIYKKRDDGAHVYTYPLLRVKVTESCNIGIRKNENHNLSPNAYVYYKIHFRRILLRFFYLRPVKRDHCLQCDIHVIEKVNSMVRYVDSESAHFQRYVIHTSFEKYFHYVLNE